MLGTWGSLSLLIFAPSHCFCLPLSLALTWLVDYKFFLMITSACSLSLDSSLTGPSACDNPGSGYTHLCPLTASEGRSLAWHKAPHPACSLRVKGLQCPKHTLHRPTRSHTPLCDAPQGHCLWPCRSCTPTLGAPWTCTMMLGYPLELCVYLQVTALPLP